MSPYGFCLEMLQCLKLKLIDGLVYSSLDILKAFDKLDGLLDLMELYRKVVQGILLKLLEFQKFHLIMKHIIFGNKLFIA